MTEFWVSQGNKWCDFCKIYISNNSTSIRTHELGTRHKENVTKKLADIKKDTAVKEKEKLLALKDLQKIEAQAKKSYERDLAAMRSLDRKVGSTAHGGIGHDKINHNFVKGRILEAAKGQATPSTIGDTKRTRTVAQDSAGASRLGRSGKGMVASSLEVSKRKRVVKSGSKSCEEEAAALAARESAKKRIKEREESLLGLYQSF